MSLRLGRDIKHAGNRISRNAHIALRAEGLIARRRLSVMRTQTGLMLAAGLVAGIGLVMLNVAAFYWLSAAYGNGAAAAIVSGVNFLLALVLAVGAARINVEKELEPAIEVRDLAIEDIKAEIGDAVAEVQDVAENVRKLARAPLGAAGSGLLAALLSLLANVAKK